MTTTEKKIITTLTSGLAQTISRVAWLTGSNPSTVKKVRDYALHNNIISVYYFEGCKVAYKLNDVVTYWLTDSNAVVSSVNDEVFWLEVNVLQDVITDKDENNFTQKVRLQISRELLEELKKVPTGHFDYDDNNKNVPFF